MIVLRGNTIQVGMTTRKLKAMGSSELLVFDFLHGSTINPSALSLSPLSPPQVLISAMEQLYNLGALDVGRYMLKTLSLVDG